MKTSFKRNLTLEVAFCILLAISVGTLLRGISLAKTVRCGGELSNALIESKDFLADILPPPGYIVESHLLITQLIESDDYVQQKECANRLRVLSSEYEKSHNKWLEVSERDTTKIRAETQRCLNQFLIEAHVPAREFFDIAKTEFLGLIEKNEKGTAIELYRSKLLPRYNLHRAAIDEAVKQGALSVERVIAETDLATTSLIRVFSVFGIAIALVFGIGMFCGFQYYKRCNQLTQQLRESLDCSGLLQASCDLSTDGNILSCTDRFSKLLGSTEAIGKRLWSFFEIKASKQSEFDAFLKDALDGRSPKLSLRLAQTDLSVEWIEVHLHPVIDKDGKIAKLVATLHDVTEHRRTSEELEDLRVRANIIDMTSIVSEADLKGDILTINEKFIEVSKYSREELIGAPHNTTRHPDMPKEVFKELWGTIGKGKTFRGKIKNLAKDGTPYYVDAVIAPVLGENGKPRKYIGVRYDITEAEIERQNAKGVLDAVDNAFSYAEFSTSGVFMQVNKRFQDALGCNESDLVGKHHSTIAPPEYAQSKEYESFWNQLASGETFSRLFQNRSRDGRELWMQAVYAPVKDEMGRVTKVVMIGIDVTETSLTNVDVQGQLKALDRVEAIIEFNLDGTVRRANENFQATLGYSLDEIRGKHHSMFVEPSYAGSAEYKHFWDNLRAGKFDAAVYKRIGKGGKTVWIQASYNPIFDLNGKPYKVVKFATDITASKEMEFAIAERKEQDEREAKEMQEKVREILDVVSLVSRKDYSRKLTVSGDDAIGQLGAGLSKFFVDKEQTEIAEEARSERERALAQETDRKVAVVLGIVNSVADGDFTIDIPDLGNDAVGQVASALGSAVVAMKDALSEVSNVASTVASAAEQLTEASREISSGAQSQASSLEETASSLEEITSTVKQNSDNAQQARQLANGSRDIAERGGSVVSDAVVAMGQINEASKKISDIITTIDEIAFQTNLLALNAAVEAARAGEQGRGFAVVAAEVRNLAQRSASAAKEIKTLIQDSVSKVDNGTELVNASGATLGEIVGSVKRVTDIVAEIAAASKEQLTGVEQVNKAVAQMDRVTQGNAAQTEEMTGTATMLLSHAKQLSDLVSGFKLDREPTRRGGNSNRGENHSVKHDRPAETSHRPAPVTVPTLGSMGSGVLEF